MKPTPPAPEAPFPASGGSYVADKATGTLTRQNPVPNPAVESPVEDPVKPAVKPAPKDGK